MADGLRVFEEIDKECRVSLWEYDWRHLSFRHSFTRGLKLFRDINPHLILFNSSEDEVLAPIWAAFFCGISTRIMVVHWAQSSRSLPLFHSKSGFPLPIPSRYSFKIRMIRAASYNLLSKIVFVNNMTRKSYAHLYKIPSNRCVTIYNGINVDAFSDVNEQRSRTRNELRLNSHDCMVLAAGNLTEVKGHKYLISAVRELVSEGISVKCFIAGQGELREILEQQILELGLENNVKLLGYCTNIPNLLCAADIFCMPSLNEALGYSLLEAIAAGIPVVASRVGGIPEVIKHGGEGLLVQPGNAHELYLELERLWRNPDLRQDLALSGIKTAQKRFSLKRMLTQTESLFQKELYG